MKYQALKQLKTKTKLLKLCDSLKEAHEVIKEDGGKFICFSYIGGFPAYRNEVYNRHYNIQGLVEGLNVMCSLNKEELSKFNFND